MAGGGSPREKMTYPACSPALCRDCGRPSCKSPRSLYGRGVGECAGAAGDRGCDFGAHDMNRSGDAACRRSCLQQPETLVRGLGPHRQDRLRILHPITYVIAILCFHSAARDWRQADTMQAEGGRGRTADGAPAAAAPGETLEGAVSAAVAARDILLRRGRRAGSFGGVLPREPVRARPAVQDMLLQPRLLCGRLFS